MANGDLFEASVVTNEPAAPIAAERPEPPRVVTANRRQVQLRPCDLESLVPPDHRARARWSTVERLELPRCYAAIAAQLPPRERRALVLIDPPYEEPRTELDAALAAAAAAIARLANAVVALWYPIKDERALEPWLRRVAQLAAPVLAAELWVHPCDTAVGLNGSGLLIVNPPWQFDAGLARWQPELGHYLDTAGHGGTAQRWIVHEQP